MQKGFGGEGTWGMEDKIPLSTSEYANKSSLVKANLLLKHNFFMKP